MRFGGIVLVTALTLGACSSEAEPREPDPATPAPSTSAAPAVALPTMPPQASEDSPAGAAAFVAHYVDVFNYAAATGDVDELRRLSSPDCDGCQSYIDLYEKTYAAGGYFRGGDWKIGELKLEFDPAETFVTTTVDLSPTRYRGSSTSTPTEGPGRSSKITFGVTGEDRVKLLSQLALGGAR